MNSHGVVGAILMNDIHSACNGNLTACLLDAAELCNSLFTIWETYEI